MKLLLANGVGHLGRYARVVIRRTRPVAQERSHPAGAVRPKVLIALNTAWNLYNFRAGLIRALQQAGYEVVTCAPADEYVDRVRALGCRFIPLQQDNHGTSVLSELALLWRYWKVLRAEKPAAYLGYTVKPNTYGSLIAGLLGMTVINNVSGLGTVFLRGGWLDWLVQRLYGVALRRSSRVFFQNTSDRDIFLARRLVRMEQAGLLPGSGVDLERFRPPADDILQQPARSSGVCFLMVARVVRDKGVVEFADAARAVKARYPHARFLLLGPMDPANPRGIARSELQGWVDAQVIEYLGASSDVRPYLATAHCMVLPSYREGTSRALLEAAAMGRPVIAADVPGCREVVEDGRTGLLCQPYSAASLAEKMSDFLELGADRRAAMGAAGREKMLREYDEAFVIASYLAALRAFSVEPAPGYVECALE